MPVAISLGPGFVPAVNVAGVAAPVSERFHFSPLRGVPVMIRESVVQFVRLACDCTAVPAIEMLPAAGGVVVSVKPV